MVQIFYFWLIQIKNLIKGYEDIKSRSNKNKSEKTKN